MNSRVRRWVRTDQDRRISLRYREREDMKTNAQVLPCDGQEVQYRDGVQQVQQSVTTTYDLEFGVQWRDGRGFLGLT